MREGAQKGLMCVISFPGDAIVMMKNKRSNHEDEGEYVRERKRGVLKSGEKECPEGRRERESLPR